MDAAAGGIARRRGREHEHALSEEHRYVGGELELFRCAVNWKAYWSGIVRRYLRGDVLEVGAGLGANTAVLRPGVAGRWVCLEPDPKLATAVRASLSPAVPAAPAAAAVDVVAGTTACLRGGPRFDAVVYLDVLEHIADDHGELARAAALLRASGHLIVLAPAHQRLFSPFDAAIGHHRRYDRRTLMAAAPKTLALVHFAYLDSTGLLASLANRAFLKQEAPTPTQLLFWDRVVVRISRVLDPVFGHRLGKSLVGVWRKPAA